MKLLINKLCLYAGVLLMLVAYVEPEAQAQSRTRQRTQRVRTLGGGNLEIARAVRIEKFIGTNASSPLREATIAFIDSFQQNPEILAEPYRNALQTMIQDGLVDDIRSSPYELNAVQPCFDNNNKEVSASTENGQKQAAVTNIYLASRSMVSTYFPGLPITDQYAIKATEPPRVLQIYIELAPAIK